MLLLLVIFFSGCVSQPKPDAELAKDMCIKECQKALDSNQDLNNGPCLSNQIIKDWVCDIAHSPRQLVDDNSINQCNAFGSDEAHHFVEVDTGCNLIRVY